MTNSLYFLIEGGETLSIAKDHIADYKAAAGRNQVILDELGVDRFFQGLDGTVIGVVFNGEPHPDFTKPKANGYSRPKGKTEWARRFEKQVGYDKSGYKLAEKLSVPTVIRYSTPDGSGSSAIGPAFFSGTGILFLSEEGPYALYIPDVAAKVAKYEAQGKTIEEPCKSFTPKFDGARPILKEEWDFICAQHDLEKARARAA
jgi:hypothetical protein